MHATRIYSTKRLSHIEYMQSVNVTHAYEIPYFFNLYFVRHTIVSMIVKIVFLILKILYWFLCSGFFRHSYRFLDKPKAFDRGHDNNLTRIYVCVMSNFHLWYYIRSETKKPWNSIHRMHSNYSSDFLQFYIFRRFVIWFLFFCFRYLDILFDFRLFRWIPNTVQISL